MSVNSKKALGEAPIESIAEKNNLPLSTPIDGSTSPNKEAKLLEKAAEDNAVEQQKAEKLDKIEEKKPAEKVDASADGMKKSPSRSSVLSPSVDRKVDDENVPIRRSSSRASLIDPPMKKNSSKSAVNSPGSDRKSDDAKADSEKKAPDLAKRFEDKKGKRDERSSRRVSFMGDAGSVSAMLQKLNAKAAEEDADVSTALYPETKPIGSPKAESEAEESEEPQPPMELKLEPITLNPGGNPNDLMEQMARQAEQVRLMIEQSKKQQTTPARSRPEANTARLLYFSIPFWTSDSSGRLMLRVRRRLLNVPPLLSLPPLLIRRSVAFSLIIGFS